MKDTENVLGTLNQPFVTSKMPVISNDPQVVELSECQFHTLLRSEDLDEKWTRENLPDWNNGPQMQGAGWCPPVMLVGLKPP